MTHAIRTRVLALVAIVLAGAALMLVALSAGGSRSPATADAAAKKVTITIKDYEYSKKTLTVKKGTVVTWINRDEMKHTATSSKKGGPRGPRLGKDETYTWTANTRGTFKYHCIPHPFMKATIIVK